ncbi:MAG: DNRLRE domain-containing protein [Anaerohalosphaeraceae bacterium]
MRKICFLATLCLVSSWVSAAGIKYAVDSCRTSLHNGTISEADAVKYDTNKLSVRGDNKASKSWIKFDISDLDVDSLTECKLRITLYAAKTSSCLLSVVNDDCTDNLNWTHTTLTWNNGPGNYTSSDGVNPDDTSITAAQLQDILNPAKTTLVETVDYTYGGLAGDQFTFDVLPYLQADTDGIVQFVLHAAGGSTDFAAHTTTSGEAYFPALVYSEIPTGTCTGVGVLHSTYADMSCRTSLFESDSDVNENQPDNNKLSVRGDNKAKKSWIKFDINDLGIDPNSLKSATLRITLYDFKDGTCSLSAVNDNYTTNIDWTESTLTWNNAPGNYTSSDGINPDNTSLTTDNLQEDLDPTRTTLIGTVDYSAGEGSAAGTQFTMDVLSILQADTDGIIQFVLHDASGFTSFATHDTSAGEAYWPRLQLLQAPAGADNPYPCPGTVVSTDLAGLSWTNPDPNDGVSDITCTVYFGSEPNRPQMDSITLDAGDHAVLINTTNFPTYGSLVDKTTYYWIVDCSDPSAGTTPIEGLMWDFYVNNNDAPVVNAGPDQVVWLGKSGVASQEVVFLDGTTSDDGKPTSTYTILWTQVDNGAPALTITPNDVDDTSIIFTEVGDYELMLTANDGEAEASDTVRIVVGQDACDASHLSRGDAYDAGDVNQDCIVNLEDFAVLISSNWLDCTDTLTQCQ